MKNSNFNINRRQFMAAGGASLFSMLSCSGFSKPQKKNRPNIVVIMADDMGFSDAGCYGGEIQTPNLDRLAAKGLRFTQFYNTARCCPTRASLLTGQYPHQVGLTINGRSSTRNGVTIAEALKETGYDTAMVGKWHLSKTPVLPDPEQHQIWLDHQYDPGQPFGPLDTYPVSRGFDKHYGVVWGVINFFDPFSLVDGLEPVKTVPKDYYFTDAISDKAVEYVESFQKSDRPFFLYMAHCAPHWPLHARPGDIAKYKDTYRDGWHKLRRDRYRRMIKMGLFKKDNTPLPPVQERDKKWSELSPEEKKFQSAKMSVHAAMVDSVDQSIGELLKTLERTGQLDNTIIFFLSDNGASPETPKKPGYDRTRETRDGRKVRYTGPFDPGSETTYLGIGTAWASASNTPFRYWKKESFEGGCHTPMIVHWPTGLGVEGGSITDEVGHVMDVMPTCLELAGADYPSEYKGHKITPLMGKSLAPVLNGGKAAKREKLFFEHVGGRAVREGDWKLVALPRQKWELYNLKTDRTEMTNLASKHPDRVKAMTRDWEEWARKVGLKK